MKLEKKVYYFLSKMKKRDGYITLVSHVLTLKIIDKHDGVSFDLSFQG